MITKRLLFLLLCINATFVQAQIQTNTPWVWIKGDSLRNGQYSYGTKGISSTNNTPRARNKAVYWTGKDGNFWLFSGMGADGFLTDLWKYSPLSNEWTWVHGDSTSNNPGSYGVKGVSAPSNLPIGRHQGVGWTDKDGNLWLFGGSRDGNDYGISQVLNDLWKYNISTNEWTWIKGDSAPLAPSIEGIIGQSSPDNTPSSRRGSSKWTDAAGNFWLFGGYGRNIEEQLSWLNDIWKYDVATNSWTLLLAGSNNTSIYPYGRYKAASWIDQQGKLWIFGGLTTEFITRPGYLGDTWQYDPGLNQWALKHGSNIPGALLNSRPGVPGIVSNYGPGASHGRVTWIDGNNDLWLFGGTAFGEYENHLWKYNIAANTWTFMKGDTVWADQKGVYGTQGVADTNNRPGKRAFSAAWQDRFGNFYLFGGTGFDAKGQSGSMNDMWKIASNLSTSVPEEPAAGEGIYLFTSSNYTTLHIRGLKQERNWQSLEIISLNGSRISINNGLAGKTQFDCTIGHLQTGTYTTVIRNKKGERAVMKFIKL